MSAFEYKVVPAPQKGQKSKGIKGAEARFALALETLMNDMAAEGWEYQRAETLPSQERSGLTGSTTEWRNLLIFRRAKNITDISVVEDDFEPQAQTLPPLSPRRLPGPQEAVGEEDFSNLAHLNDARSAVKTTD